MTTALVTAAEVAAAWPAFSSLSPTEQAQLIASATDAINSEADRIFGQGAYVEYDLHPGRSLRIVLRQWPVVSLSLRADLLTLLQVQYAASGAVRGAISYTTTGTPGFETVTGLQLNPVPGTAVPLLFSTYTTVQALADAINAEPGWTATVTSGYGDWLTSELNAQVGTLDAFTQPASIDAFVRDVGGIPDRPGPLGSPVVRLSEAFPDAARYPDRMHRGRWAFGAGGWTTGDGALAPRYGGLVASYTAGYATADVPGDIKQAAIAAITFFKDRQTSPGAFKSKTIGKVSYTLGDIPTTPLPEWVCRLLDRHRPAYFA